MSTARVINTQRAEAIAKVFLLNSGLVEVMKSLDGNSDFWVIGRKAPYKKLAVEVKPTKYSKSEIKKNYAVQRTLLQQSDMPVLMFYVDCQKDKGFFEVLNHDASNDIEPLDAPLLDLRLKELMA
jgi:hypothetical protein